MARDRCVGVGARRPRSVASRIMAGRRAFHRRAGGSAGAFAPHRLGVDTWSPPLAVFASADMAPSIGEPPASRKPCEDRHRIGRRGSHGDPRCASDSTESLMGNRPECPDGRPVLLLH